MSPFREGETPTLKILEFLDTPGHGSPVRRPAAVVKGSNAVLAAQTFIAKIQEPHKVRILLVPASHVNDIIV